MKKYMILVILILAMIFSSCDTSYNKKTDKIDLNLPVNFRIWIYCNKLEGDVSKYVFIKYNDIFFLQTTLNNSTDDIIEYYWICNEYNQYYKYERKYIKTAEAYTEFEKILEELSIDDVEKMFIFDADINSKSICSLIDGTTISQSGELISESITYNSIVCRVYFFKEVYYLINPNTGLVVLKTIDDPTDDTLIVLSQNVFSITSELSDDNSFWKHITVDRKPPSLDSEEKS